MVIKILGSGCKKCKKMESNVKEVIDKLGIDARIEKVEDFKEIMKYGAMTTPALVIDEELVSSGKLLKPKEIEKLLER